VIRRILAACTLVAVIATTGSLYFSEIANLPPCELCWYQRILMYPLVVVLGVAVLEEHRTVWKTGLPLSVLGIGVAAYHTFIQFAPDTVSSTCTIGGCTGTYWTGLGIFTIPRLSLVAFVLVTAGLLAVAYVDTQTAR
jgi:disulfide bond formation protein DsbB